MNEIASSPDDFASIFETSFARLQILIEEACAASADWPSGVAAAIHAAFEFAADDPGAAAALTNEALAAGADGIARHRRLLAYLAEGLAPGRELRAEGPALPDVTEQAMAGGLVSLVAERLTRDRLAELPDLAPEAIQFALTPYVGAAEAKRIAAAGKGR
ncbi:MAG TPA: hypothetical protein VF085_02130 [Solirubrobacterales bacterium]